VAAYKVQIEQFQGPLDLLLRLIEKEKLDITEVALSKVTEQYLKHLELIEESLPEDLADFLVIATKLLYIKSKALLPYLYPEDDDETDLAEQLKMYKLFLEAAKKLDQTIKSKKILYPKEQLRLIDMEVKFSPPKKLTKTDLKKTFIQILKKLEPIVRLPQVALTRVVSLKEKLADIQALIFTRVKMSFNELLEGAEDRTEVVVIFLAILELTKQKIVKVEQAGNFSEISIEKNNINKQV